MTEDIVHEATYPHPPAAVWRAITTPEALGSWLMENDFREPTVGHKFQFRDTPKKVVGWNGITDCEVVEVVPERRLVIAFGTGRDGFPATRVAFELEPAGPGTRVRFRHSGFTGLKGWLMRAGMNNGWGRMVKSSIPFVVREMEKGRVPPREETTAVSKAATRADVQAAKARA